MAAWQAAHDRVRPATLRVVATVPSGRGGGDPGLRQGARRGALQRALDRGPARDRSAADPRTHTTRIRLELAGDVRGVYPGVYARAHFVTGRAPRLLVPRQAVLRRGEVPPSTSPASAACSCARCGSGTAGDERAVEVLAGGEAGGARRARSGEGGARRGGPAPQDSADGAVRAARRARRSRRST